MIDPVCLRSLVKRYRSSHQFESAVFWAEKLVAHGKQQFENADPGSKRELMLTYECDLLALGELFMLKGEFLRASRILGKYSIPSDSSNVTQIRYQIAKCLFEARQFCEALELLNAILTGWNDSGSGVGTRKNLKSEFEKVAGTPRLVNVRPARTDGPRRSTNANTNTNATSVTASVRKRQSVGRSESGEMRAACLLLLAKVHMELESRGEACELLRSALQLDPFCVEAWQILQRGALLSEAESAQLLRTVSQPQPRPSCETEQPGVSVRALLADLCELRLHACNFAAGPADEAGGPRRFDACISRLAPLRASVDVQLAAAERALALSNYAEALATTTRLLDEADSLHTDALVVHTAALVALRKANELFRLAHTLMDDADAGTSPGVGVGAGGVPLQAVSWYVSAAYYYVVGNREACRKQAGRALQLAPSFVAGWLLVGHTLADEFEYDQAISAYSHANKLCRNAPHTLVCVALAYSRVRNARVAGEFLRAAYRLRTADPHTLNELGVLAYSERDYPVAVRFLRRAFRILTVTDVHTDAEDAEDSLRIDFGAVRIALSGEWTPLINNLGHALRRAGRLEEAIAAHRFALRLNVHHAPTWNALALALACASRFDDAAAAVERALRLSANDVFAYDLFEKLLAKLADATTACKLNDVPSGAASVTHNRYEPVGFEKTPDVTVEEPNRMHVESADESTTKLKTDPDGDGASQIETAFFRKLRERAAARSEEPASASVFKVPRAAAWRASVVGVGVGTVPSSSSTHIESVAPGELATSTSASNLDASACSSNNRSAVESDQSTTSRDDDGDVLMDC